MKDRVMPEKLQAILFKKELHKKGIDADVEFEDYIDNTLSYPENRDSLWKHIFSGEISLNTDDKKTLDRLEELRLEVESPELIEHDEIKDKDIVRLLNKIKKAIKEEHFSPDKRKELGENLQNALSSLRKKDVPNVLKLFRNRNDEDKIKEFIESELEITKNPSDRITKAKLHQLYLDYCKRKYAMSVGIKGFGKYLVKAAGVTSGWITTGYNQGKQKQAKAWLGIKVKEIQVLPQKEEVLDKKPNDTKSESDEKWKIPSLLDL